MVQAPSTPQQVQALPLVEILRRIWIQQFYVEVYVEEGQIYWRGELLTGRNGVNLLPAGLLLLH
jgi:hypothetical protein